MRFKWSLSWILISAINSQLFNKKCVQKIISKDWSSKKRLKKLQIIYEIIMVESKLNEI